MLHITIRVFIILVEMTDGKGSGMSQIIRNFNTTLMQILDCEYTVWGEETS